MNVRLNRLRLSDLKTRRIARLGGFVDVWGSVLEERFCGLSQWDQGTHYIRKICILAHGWV
jgi:hypothetical protein